jgi:V8-like Glu-specific endopeptidase
LTAGHCVHSGSGGAAGFYTNFIYIPAFRDGSAPYGTWTTTYVNVTNTWATGGDTFPNAADYAMLEMKDQSIGGSVKKIGNVTGYLGYQLQSLIPNHVHQIGYPCNFDNCAKMHQVTTQSAVAVSPNNVEYGSDMGGGSSGGPWIQNFGAPSPQQTGGNNPGVNRVVGVTSWGYTDSSLMALGASIFDNRFTDLLTSMCNHQTGNC